MNRKKCMISNHIFLTNSENHIICDLCDAVKIIYKKNYGKSEFYNLIILLFVMFSEYVDPVHEDGAVLCLCGDRAGVYGMCNEPCEATLQPPRGGHLVQKSIGGLHRSSESGMQKDSGASRISHPKKIPKPRDFSKILLFS